MTHFPTAPSLFSTILISRMLVDAENPSLSHNIHTGNSATHSRKYPTSIPTLTVFLSLYPYYTHYTVITDATRIHAFQGPEILNMFWRSGVFAHNDTYHSTLQCPHLDSDDVNLINGCTKKSSERQQRSPLSIQKFLGHVSKSCSTVAHQR